MPFKSKQQVKACYASKGFGGKVDCEEWSKKTDYKKLPQKIENSLPFQELQNKNCVIRTFSKDVNSEELKWHRDREDRIIVPLQETDWMFQRDNCLPEKIKNKIYIKANEWHRVIKGINDLVIRVYK